MPAEIDTGGPRVLHCHYRADDCPIPIVGSASAAEVCSRSAVHERRFRIDRPKDECVYGALAHVPGHCRIEEDRRDCGGPDRQAAREGESQGKRQCVRRGKRREVCQGDCQGKCEADRGGCYQGEWRGSLQDDCAACQSRLPLRRQTHRLRAEVRQRRQSVRRHATTASIRRQEEASRILRLATRPHRDVWRADEDEDEDEDAGTTNARIEHDQRHASARSEDAALRLGPAVSIVPFECDSALTDTTRRLYSRRENSEDGHGASRSEHRRILPDSIHGKQPQFSSHPHSHYPEKGKSAFLNSSLSPAADKEWEKEIRSNSLRYPKREDASSAADLPAANEFARGRSRTSGWERACSKSRSYFQLAFLLFLVAFGQSGLLKSGVLNFSARPTVATGLSVFAFGTVIGAVSGAPVDLISDTGVRAERSANLSHITGASRKIQMYIKNRHLQILPDGTVNGSNDDTSDYTIFQRTSVSRGQLRIQGVATCLYLCMDSCGLLYGSRDYTEDCVFNETLEQHNYNTYSSVRWSTAKKTLYLGLNRRGQPRRVQAKGHNLGRLSAYARVLTQVAPPDRVETLQRRMLGAQHNVRHRHNSHAHHHHRADVGQQTVCPSLPPQEKDGRDRFRCRKRKKRKKRKRRCRPGEKPGPQCQAPEDVLSETAAGSMSTPTPTSTADGAVPESKRSCEGLASEEACRRQALSVLSKKRKARLEAAADAENSEEEEEDEDEEPRSHQRQRQTAAGPAFVPGNDTSNGKNKAPTSNAKKPSVGAGVSQNKKPNLTDGKKRKRKGPGPRRKGPGPGPRGTSRPGQGSARPATESSARRSTTSSSSSRPAAAAAAGASTGPSSGGRRASPRRRTKLSSSARNDVTSSASAGTSSPRRARLLDRHLNATIDSASEVAALGGRSRPTLGTRGRSRPTMHARTRFRATAVATSGDAQSSTTVPENFSPDPFPAGHTTRSTEDLGSPRPSDSSFSDEELLSTTASSDSTTMTPTTTLTTLTTSFAAEETIAGGSVHGLIESEDADADEEEEEDAADNDDEVRLSRTTAAVTHMPLERLAM